MFTVELTNNTIYFGLYELNYLPWIQVNIVQVCPFVFLFWKSNVLLILIH